MGDSSSFSSLFALVDNHLSRSNIQHDPSQPSTSGLGSFKPPSLNVQRGLSDTRLPSTSRFPMPSLSISENPINDILSRQLSNMFPATKPKVEDDDDDDDDDEDENPQRPGMPAMHMSDCPINDVLAIQLSNMFKAREAKEEEERRRQEELRKVEETLRQQRLNESSCLIDLMPAVQLPGQIQPHSIGVLSSGSSMESVVLPDTTGAVDGDIEDMKQDPEAPSRPVSPLKPITTDMRYILKHKIGKCSPFGKVLCARYRSVAAPYVRERVPIPPCIKVFDFSTPSPDDIILERLRKPLSYNNSRNTLSVYE